MKGMFMVIVGGLLMAACSTVHSDEPRTPVSPGTQPATVGTQVADSAVQGGYKGTDHGHCYDVAAGRAMNPEVVGARRLKMTIPADAPAIGPANAPVTVVVFADFQCPFTRRFVHVMHRVMKRCPGDVRLVFVNFPLRSIHRGAQIAAEAAMEAMAQGRFKEMCCRIFDNQPRITGEELLRWGGEAGMDTGRLEQALESGRWKNAVEAHRMLGLSLGVRATPTILINGRLLRDYRDEEVVLNTIYDELAFIRQRNIPRDRAWQVLTADGVRTVAELASQKTDVRRRPRRPRHGKFDSSVRYEVTFTAQDPWRGTRNALVTIVEFGDYQCPFCARADATIERLLKEYHGMIRHVYLQNPLSFHRNARALSNAALEVLAQKGLGAYWKFHGFIFTHQRMFYGRNFMNAVRNIARQVGADPAKVEEAVMGDRYRDVITRHQQMALRFNAVGTPTFFINGYSLRGAQPIEKFRAIIDREISKARALIRAGRATPRNYYDYIMRTAAPRAIFMAPESR